MSEQFYNFVVNHKTVKPSTIEKILTGEGYNYPAMVEDGFRYNPLSDNTLLYQAEWFNFVRSEGAF